jgi:isoquinoline 1-oxidoreductase beta subunit
MNEEKQRSRLRTWTRRGFLVTAGVVGGGFALGLTLSPNRLQMSSDNVLTGDDVMLNTWVKIAPDNTITVIVPHSELGQGAGTGLAQMLAEEMEANWETVRIQQAPALDEYVNSDLGRGYLFGDGAQIPGFMFPMLDFALLQMAGSAIGQLTGGSTAIRLTGQYGMRRAGAAAREMMMQAAAAKWDVPQTMLDVRDSVIRHAASGRTATFGELSTSAANFTPNLKPALKDPTEFRIVGQSKPRFDLPAKVDGTAQYGMDVVVPDMVYAAIAMPPVRDARVVNVDEARLTDRPGLGRVLNLGDVIAVTADSYWTASQALEELSIEWGGGQKDLSSASLHAQLDANLTDGAVEVMDSAGNAAAVTGGSERLKAEYAVPYLAHATMEPMNCTVSIGADSAEIWTGHQNPYAARNAAAETLGLEPTQVTMHPVYLGGGFGRRSEMDFVTLPVRIAKELQTPVKVIWSRETDMTNDTYRPAVLSRMEGEVEGGRITAFRHRYTEMRPGRSEGEGPFLLPYDLPNRDIGRVICESPIPVGSWRAVEFTQLGFFHEAFMDELAERAGADPLEFRLAHITRPRIRAVLERLRTEASWQTSLPEGHAQGMALVESFGSIVAQAVEVSVTSDGGVRVHNVTSVVDCGQLINPDSGAAQITGGVVFGLTAALFGEITLKGGEVEQRNFPDYDMLRLANAPAQSVHFMQSTQPPGGLGEPGTPPVAPALVNALYQITGERIRALPINKHGLYAL